MVRAKDPPFLTSTGIPARRNALHPAGWLKAEGF